MSDDSPGPRRLAGDVPPYGGSTIMDRPAADAPAPLLTQDSQRLAASQRGTSPARRLWSLISADRRRLVLMLLWQFLQVLTFVPFTIGTQYLVDDIFPYCQRTGTWWPVLAYLGANLLLWPLHAWCTVGAFARSQSLVRLTIARLRRMIVDQLQRLSLSFFAARGSGALSNQLTVDLAKVEGFLTSVASGLFIAFSVGACALAWLLITQPFLALVAMLGIPVQLLVQRTMYRRLSELNHRLQGHGESFAARIVEFVAGMRQTKSFGNEDLMAQRLGHSIEELRTTGLDAAITARWMNMWVQMTWQFATTVLWCVGIVAMLGVFGTHISVTMGQLIAFMGLFAMVQQGFNAYPGLLDGWATAGPGMAKVVEVLDSDELEEYLHPRHDVALRRDISGEISFRDVSFRYPQSATEVLRGLSLTISAGQRVGLVGETGAGKSTFLDLVLGFYHPTSGTITYDGFDLADIGRRQLRRVTAIMTQEAFLWNATVRENIRFGRPAATNTEIEEAARRAQADEFIRKMDDGYNTIVGERGGKLSGGQRQRLALARVFLRDPRLVVLDEPTSALDLVTEARLQEDLDRLCHGRTTFIVAHRLSTLRSVDRILVFEDGRVIEDGTPAELLARPDGRFARMHRLQSGSPIDQSALT